MLMFCFYQKRNTKRRLKPRGDAAASERAVSIPQITYDHIDDSEEKRDVSFCLVQEEQSGSVEGEAPVQRLLSFETGFNNKFQSGQGFLVTRL